MKRRLLVATRNHGKVLEIAELLKETDYELAGLDEIGLELEVAETGDTFRENAVIKALAYAQASGLLTLADDSGLEVDALNSKPGVQTARFGGGNLTPQERYTFLLKQIADVPWEKRTARFCCVMALALPGKLLATTVGDCPGQIAFEPSGRGGFGYDPVFYLPEYGMTMAELAAEEKNRISHRGQALAHMIPILEAFHEN